MGGGEEGTQKEGKRRGEGMGQNAPPVGLANGVARSPGNHEAARPTHPKPAGASTARGAGSRGPKGPARGPGLAARWAGPAGPGGRAGLFLNSSQKEHV